MSSNSVTRRAVAEELDSKILFCKRKKSNSEESPSMSVSDKQQASDRRPNFSAVNGGVLKTSATIASKPGDIRKIVIKNFKSEWPPIGGQKHPDT